MAVPIHQDPDRASRAFGRRVREVRKRRAMSQDDLARETDIHPTSIGRIERGGREVKLTTILRLAHGMGVEPGELTDKLAD
jgi:transcriptional regulator with XRE-family HTH domain